MPAVSLKAFGCTLAECQVSKTFDGDVIVVVEINQFAEFQMTCERGGFRRDAFHQIAIGHDAVNVVIDQRKVRSVEFGGQMSRAHRHPDAVRKALAQRPGRDLNSRRQAVLRMARRLRSPLAEVFDLVERQIVTGEIEQRVKQHATVTGGEQKAIAILPLRILRVVAHKAGPQDISHRRGAERQAGMS